LVDKLDLVNSKYGINIQSSSAVYHDDDTDTYNFWDANLPAVYTNECTGDDSYPGYHSPTDSVSYVNFTALRQTTQLMVAALAELSSQ
jgi:aminopeptidase-like protein